MEKIVKYALWIITVICLYVILNVGLGWFWTIGSASNSEKINLVLINLSYSYIAGFIFYILVSYLPYRLKVEKIKPVINLKIDDLYKQINHCAQTFETVEIEDIIKTITLERLKEIVYKNDLYHNSFYANIVGYNMNNFQFLVSTRESALGIINSLLEYKDYMETEQLLNLERIKDCTFFRLVKVYEDSSTAMSYYRSFLFKDAIITDLYEIINYIQVLKNCKKNDK